MKNKLSIIIQGAYVNKTEKLIKKIFQDFEGSEVILSIPKNTNNIFLKKIKKNKIKLANYTPQKDFLDYGKKTKNFLNYFLSICEAIKYASNNYIIIFNSNFNYSKIDLTNYKFEKKKIEYYHFSTSIDKIFLYSKKDNKIPSMILGRKFILKKMFNFSENSYPNIFNTTIFPLNILQTKGTHKDMQLTIEDILQIIFIKKSLDKNHSKINFDEIIGNFDIFDQKISSSFIKINSLF